ncbi:MAG TPA: Xaa-Pro aminopeptidase [Streptosporangiaceae bacterium]|nr:Xaa-Pro aminopeptidase [Streptosporangiaceae bacterium]
MSEAVSTLADAEVPAGAGLPGGDRLSTGSFNDPVSPRLADFMSASWGDQPEAPAPPAPPAARLAARRDQLRAHLPAPLPVVVPAGQPSRRSNDQFYPFRPGSDYVWLAGDQSPAGVLILDPSSAAGDALFVAPPSRRDNGEFWTDSASGELWVGRRHSLTERAETLGITCRPLAELPERLAGLGEAIVSRGFDASIERQVTSVDPVLDAELAAVLAELRLVKDGWEIDQLRAAVDATTLGFCDVAALILDRPGLTERHVEAAFAGRSRLEGNGVGYHPIAAAGAHATTLHWSRNDGPLGAGDLLLLDAGVETQSLYTADVTRTFPVSGRFSAMQRRVYGYVLAAQEAGLAALRPGADFREYHRVCARVLAEALEDLGVLPVTAAESLQPDCGLHRRWTLCAPGHMMGLDVHDCASAREARYLGGPLEAGQVLTVEPGLYFQANDDTIPPELRGLGIRIEDDVLITSGGYELLSSALPREPDEIEAWCADPGRIL